MKRGVKFLVGTSLIFGTSWLAMITFPQVAEAAKQYTVQSGDTLWRISQKFKIGGGTSPKQISAGVNLLKKWNNLKSDLIHPGDKLFIEDPNKSSSNNGSDSSDNVYNWVKEGNNWYYKNGKGDKKKGWLKDNNKWYYLDTSTGAMKTGWQKIGGKWYYFNNSGVMQTGWLTYGGEKYYLDVSGVMVTGWQTINGQLYYFDETSGAMSDYQDIQGVDYLTGGSGGGLLQSNLLILPGGNRAVFTKNDLTRQQWYTDEGKKEASRLYKAGVLSKKESDNYRGNFLYKVEENGFTYFSPVRPKNVYDGGISSAEYILENVYVKYSLGNLGGLWTPYPNENRNFKNKQMRVDKVHSSANYNQMASLGTIVEESDVFNYSGSQKFVNERGRWRFTGYSSNGGTQQDPLFPHDYTASSISSRNWDNYGSIGNRLFAPNSLFNGPDYRDAKKELIKRLLEQVPEMKNKYTIDQWMNKLALQTEPEINPKTGQRDGKYGGAQFMAYHSNGRYYRSFVLFGDEKNDGRPNLNLSKLSIHENSSDKTIIKTASRKEPQSFYAHVTYEMKDAVVVPGQTYRVSANVINEHKAAPTKYSPTTVDLGIARNYKDYKNPYAKGNDLEPYGVHDKALDDVSGLSTKSGTIAKGGTANTEATIKIPDNAIPGSTIRLGGTINENHQKYGDNLNPNDDSLILTLEVATGNLTATDVVLVDANGKEVDNPIPGNQYKVRYKFKYEGPNIGSNTDVTVKYQNTRKIPDGKTPGGETDVIQYFKQGNKLVDDTEVTKSFRLVNGKSYSIDTKYYQWYEIPWISTEAYLSSSVSGLNYNTNDDTWKKTWNPKYDYSIKDLQVIPRTEYGNTLAADGKQHYGVSFTVVSDMPEEAAKANYAKDVNIYINLGGEEKVITEHITAGENKDIVVDMAFDGSVKENSVINAEVTVNHDHNAYEYGIGTSNNTAKTRVITSNFYKDPKTDTVINPTTMTNNTGAYVTKPVNPNKMTTGSSDNTHNSWNQVYQIESWTGTKINYASGDGKRSYSFYNYQPIEKYKQTISQQETYRIKDVLFKSKVTTDNNWGDKGWVSMITDAGHAQVRAGNGYQLKLIVEYNTNALSTEPTAYINGGNGRSVRPKNVVPNLSKDIYFQTSDGKILSATGIDKTYQVFESKILEQSDEKVVIEYTLRDTYTMGIKTPGRIYISEDTPNGMYSVRAWTPHITGVPTKNRTIQNGVSIYKPEPLWDIQGGVVSNKPKEIPSKGTDDHGNIIVDVNKVPNMHFIVIGSDKDDLVNSIIQ